MNNNFPYSKYNFNNQDLLSGLTTAECERLTANKEILNFKAGTQIFKEGTEPKGIYRVLSGKVKKYTATNFGTDHIFYICGENEYLGYHAILSEEEYPDSATALLDCEVAFIPKNDFLNVVSTSHLLSQRLLKNLSHEFGVFLNATKILARYTVRERTAINLLILQRKFSVKESLKEIEMNRDDLASMVGTAKESLVRMLKDFKEEKLISTKGRIIFIEDLEGLVKASNYK
ncbi:Crp/Fnr family transcriptional regulator [Formosa undariae]|jgi:CRP-like cAMP-binding protein|uniref:Cyclic nucleotide-binding domain protein n=3 Tax=Flavobacteriaceae TaxID=49546 RepID=A0A5J4IYH5_9FLAO|nr:MULTISPECIES: Crp/Fnr family transcriptional regulator [Flavobacteriaceae]GER60064.1 cyclic nucleotide-binding domain protein [Patiriisocius marinus]SDZ86495.1 cAMP-binding domain of CRP or a regulatory subunit of cAMP-dependent protein kinases [Bizionia paragorgiae]